tara:strand:+ start:79 stop:258 length:180 start_codon:yes stop_codon:yes gene_type:complete
MKPYESLKIKKKKKSPLKALRPHVKPVHKNPQKTSALTEAQKRRLRRGRPHKLNTGLSL